MLRGRINASSTHDLHEVNSSESVDHDVRVLAIEDAASFYPDA